MAGKAIVSFIEALSTFALEGQPSLVNLALAAMEVDQEAEHIAKTPLVVVPAPASKETPRGDKGGSAEPPWQPLGPPFDTTCRQEDLCQERQVPGIWSLYTADYRDVGTEGCLQAPLW
jgi:hypothetical protein